MPPKKPSAPKTVENVIQESYPDYRIVERRPAGTADAALDVALRPQPEATAPALTALRRKAAREFADAGVTEVDDEASLLGNSSELVTIEPSAPIDHPVSRRERRTVVVSHGKIVGEQG